MCGARAPNITTLRGTSGAVAPLALALNGSASLFVAGRCAAGLSTFYPGPRGVFYLDLGEATPLGGLLTITTCGATAANTVLHVGLGCPTSDASFRCRVGNDNAGDGGGAACAPNGLASSVALVITSRTHFVLLSGYNGVPVVSGLSWAYAPPPSGSPTAAARTTTPSATRTRGGGGSGSRSRSPAGTRSKTGSRTATRSRSRKRKLLAA
jgi:hypothetical protein